MRWLVPGREVRIETTCFHSGEQIVVRMRDEAILEVTPETAVGHVNVPFASLARREVAFGFA